MSTTTTTTITIVPPHQLTETDNTHNNNVDNKGWQQHHNNRWQQQQAWQQQRQWRQPRLRYSRRGFEIAAGAQDMSSPCFRYVISVLCWIYITNYYLQVYYTTMMRTTKDGRHQPAVSSMGHNESDANAISSTGHNTGRTAGLETNDTGPKPPPRVTTTHGWAFIPFFNTTNESSFFWLVGGFQLPPAHNASPKTHPWVMMTCGWAFISFPTPPLTPPTSHYNLLVSFYSLTHTTLAPNPPTSHND